MQQLETVDRVVSRCWERYYTRLTLACKFGNTHAVETLLKYDDRDGNGSALKIDAYDFYGNTALITAVQGGFYNIVETLLQYGAGIDVPSEELNQSPLAVALERGHHDIADLLLEKCCDVQVSDNIGITPLYLAIKQQHVGLTEKLINNGADVNLGSQDHSPVFLSARLGLLDIVKVLVKAGCDKDVANKFGVSPMYEAAAKGHVDIVEYLIGCGADVDKADMYSVTPLIVAAMFGHVTVVKALVEGGANVKIRDDQQRNALHVAMEMGHCDAVTYFLENGLLEISRDSPRYRLQSISRVFERGDAKMVEVLLRACSRLPLPHYPGVVDMFRGNSRMMKLLLYSGNHVLPGSLLADLDLLNDNDLREFLQSYRCTPRPLADICRVRIRRCLANTVLCSVNYLPLPQSLKNYICLKDSDNV